MHRTTRLHSHFARSSTTTGRHDSLRYSISRIINMRNIMQLLIFIGVQGAGKSTFCRQFYDTHIRLNRDMLKTKHRENLLFQACLDSKTPTIIDKTNPTRAERADYITRAKSQYFEIIAYYFDVDFDSALLRNNQRSGKAKVPEIGLKSTLKKLEKPSFSEGFDIIYYVRTINDEFVVTQIQPEKNHEI